MMTGLEFQNGESVDICEISFFSSIAILQT